MNKVEDLFLNKALKRGGIYFYSKSDAIQFVSECKKENIAVLGIDAFFLNPTTTQPSMDNSVDVSRSPFQREMYDTAIKFLEERDDRLYFEIVCPE